MPTNVVTKKVQVELPIFESIWTERLEEFKQAVLEHKKEFPETCKDTNVNSSWRSAWNIHQTDPRFQSIQQYFEEFANSIGDQHFYTNGVYETVNMWAMTYGPNEGTKFHCHFPSALSFIFYIDVQENSAPICIGESCRPVENGLVLAFDASIPHWVPDDCEGERICIAANLDHIPPQIRGTWRSV